MKARRLLTCAVAALQALLTTPAPAASLTSADGLHTLQADATHLHLRSTPAAVAETGASAATTAGVNTAATQRDWPLRSADGRATTVGTLLEHPGRRSFIVHLQGVAELWEILLDPAAPPLFEGLVHDYRLGEGIAQPGYLGRRRVPLPRPVQALWLHAQVPWLLALETAPSPAPVAVVHLDVRRVIAHLPLLDHNAARLAQAALTATPNGPVLRLPAVDGWLWFDTRRWQLTDAPAATPP